MKDQHSLWTVIHVYDAGNISQYLSKIFFPEFYRKQNVVTEVYLWTGSIIYIYNVILHINLYEH